MKEIIQINLGQFGTRVGHLYNQKLAQEHQLIGDHTDKTVMNNSKEQHDLDETQTMLKSRISSYFDVSSFQNKMSRDGITTSPILDASSQ